jgi:hypothetical protein
MPLLLGVASSGCILGHHLHNEEQELILVGHGDGKFPAIPQNVGWLFMTSPANWIAYRLAAAWSLNSTPISSTSESDAEKK